MSEVFSTAPFDRFMKREGLDDEALHDAITRAGRGIVDADLGGGLIKQRVARAGQGRASGYRTIIAYRRGGRAVFLFGFSKSEVANVPRDRLAALKIIGEAYLSMTSGQVAALVASGELRRWP